MAGVPDYLELTFTDYEGKGLNLTSTERDELRGRTILVRISKRHYRLHEFIIKSVSGRDNEVTSMGLERKPEPEVGETPQQIRDRQDHEAEQRGRE